MVKQNQLRTCLMGLIQALCLSVQGDYTWRSKQWRHEQNCLQRNDSSKKSLSTFKVNDWKDSSKQVFLKSQGQWKFEGCHAFRGALSDNLYPKTSWYWMCRIKLLGWSLKTAFCFNYLRKREERQKRKFIRGRRNRTEWGQGK